MPSAELTLILPARDISSKEASYSDFSQEEADTNINILNLRLGNLIVLSYLVNNRDLYCVLRIETPSRRDLLRLTAGETTAHRLQL